LVARSRLTGGEAEVVGRVAGTVLAAIRGRIARTQEQLAAELGVGLTTVQAWESGRRPLINGRFADVQRLQRHLRTAGAGAELLHLLDRALAVDSIFADFRPGEPDRHPLALVVADRTMTELLAWPLGGELPRQLDGTGARLDLPADVRDAVAANLRATVDLAAARAEDSATTALLRRQVSFLVKPNPASRDWLREQLAGDTRAIPDLRRWSPQWPVARMQAVMAAAMGDPEPVRRFIAQGLASDDGITANVNYWAYWVGEHNTIWATDAQMTRPNGEWSGEVLLDSLLEGVVYAPYRDLVAHALWTLLRRSPQLARGRGWRRRIVAAAGQALDEGRLAPDARRQVGQVAFLAQAGG
jgi:hypothetical protein